jgi:hypothetical protein
VHPARLDQKRKLGGAFFHTRVGTPRIVTVSISNLDPGWVSAARASASDMAGQEGGSAITDWWLTDHPLPKNGFRIVASKLLLIRAALKAIGGRRI